MALSYNDGERKDELERFQEDRMIQHGGIREGLGVRAHVVLSTHAQLHISEDGR